MYQVTPFDRFHRDGAFKERLGFSVIVNLTSRGGSSALRPIVAQTNGGFLLVNKERPLIRKHDSEYFFDVGGLIIQLDAGNFCCRGISFLPIIFAFEYAFLQADSSSHAYFHK